MNWINILSIIGIMLMGYFICRIIEAWTIGSWNYPKNSQQGKDGDTHETPVMSRSIPKDFVQRGEEMTSPAECNIQEVKNGDTGS